MKKICDFCKKSYKKEAITVTMFGSRFCLHDELVKNYRSVSGMPMRNTSLAVKEERNGKSSRERKYIDKERARGNTVVRGSDGILRSVGTK